PDDVVAGAPGRVARALARLHRAPDHPGTPAVRAAYRSLPRWAYGAGAAPAGRPRALVHGDWHLGQLVRLPDRGWLLVDVDDLGYGDPVWDLARPAAWYATGLLAPDSWHRFLDAYRRAGGPAVAADGDPFQPPGSELDTVARALVVQMAALALAAAARERRDLDELDQVLVDTSRRIAAG
ncbi:MAG: phosphotransferase family protein, partial [Micromonosporaceae bacterium]